MKRLPGAEVAAPRLEATVFGSLALAGLAAILLTTASYARYVEGRDAAVAVLEGKPSLESPVPANATLTSPTNVTRIEMKAIVAAHPGKA